MKRFPPILLTLILLACNNRTPVAFMDIELGKPFITKKIENNPNFIIRNGSYFYKFANGTQAYTKVFLDNNLVSSIDLWVSNGKDGAGEEICIDSTKKNYIKDLFFKKYGKPDRRETDYSLTSGNGIMESYTWYPGEMTISFDVHRIETVDSASHPYHTVIQTNNCLNIKISYNLNRKYYDKEKEKAKKDDSKNI